MFEELIGSKITVIYTENEVLLTSQGMLISVDTGFLHLQTHDNHVYISIPTIVKVKQKVDEND